MKPKVSDEQIQQAREVLLELWPWAPALPYNASVEQTVEAVRGVLKTQAPGTTFRVKIKRDRKSPGAANIDIIWTAYPNAPKVGELEKIVEPYAFWRQQSAQDELSKRGISIDSIIIAALLKDMWGPRRGVGRTDNIPTASQLATWERRQISAKKRALANIAAGAKASSRPRVKNKPSM